MIILLSLSENWVQKILSHFLAFSLHAFLSGATQDDFFSVRRIFLRRTKLRSPSRKGGISFAREMDFFCSKLCALLSSLLLCASINITASLRFLAVAAGDLPIQSSVPHSLKGLPVVDVNLAHLPNDEIASFRFNCVRLVVVLVVKVHLDIVHLVLFAVAVLVAAVLSLVPM